MGCSTASARAAIQFVGLNPKRDDDFEKILADEELHIDYLETQLELMGKMGEELYMAQCVSRPPQ